MATKKESNLRNSLPPGTTLDCYRVLKLIGSGGFSLIYLAEDEETHDEVAIKEYIPKRFGKRIGNESVGVMDESNRASFYRGRRLFWQEAKVLAMFRHPNIVDVLNCFIDNNTAYMVMNYEPGKNLGRYIKKRRGGLSTNLMLTVFPPLLDALELLHGRNHLHLDIKPSNIHLRPGGSPILLDFGAVFHLDDMGTKKAQVITPGFSPVEQYYAEGQIGAWSDVYAIGASMRTCIEGKSPPTAVERHAHDSVKPARDLYRDSYPSYLLEVIDWAMAIDHHDRCPSAADMRDALLTGSVRGNVFKGVA